MASADRAAWARVGCVAIVVLVLDQATKAAIRGSLALGASTHVLPGIELVHATNTGVAFSQLSGSSALVALLALVVLGVLLTYFARHSRVPLLWLATGMIAGGALGNLADRLRAGAVTDFIKFPDWPAFNVADSAITIGVLALVVLIGRHGSQSSA